MSKFLQGVDADEPVAISDEKTPKTSRSPFAFLEDLTEKKVPIDANLNLNGYAPFVFNRYISMSHVTCEIALLATCTRNLTDIDHYRFMFYALPKKRMYVKWLNKKGDDGISKDIEAISDIMECGCNDARSMLPLLSPDELDRIRNTYKEMTKLRNMK